MNGLKILSAEISSDAEQAWAVFCNIAMPIKDATGVSRKIANEAAAHLMQHLFEYDVTSHPLYEYGKSGAQNYAETRIAIDEAEDAQLAA